MKHAAIFDMDGLLINSEPFWQQSEIDLFKTVNIELTRELCMETMGLRIDEVIQYWYSKFPWSNLTHVELQEKIISRVIEYIMDEGKEMDGVHQTIEVVQSRGLKIALASSSHFRIIHAVLDKLKIRKYFEVVHSAEVEDYGKPHPAIYINTAKMLGVEPVNCIAFEDSFNGLIAAKAARMKTVAVPDPDHYKQTRFDIANLKLKSLSDFTSSHLIDLLKN